MSLEMTLEPYRDEANGFALLLPREWEQLDPPADEVRLVAVEPLADQGFRTNLVVTVDALPEGLSLGAWQDGNEQMMASMLDGWQLLDRITERRDDDDDDVVIRRLGHHIVAGGAPVTLRQVALIREARALTLTSSIWTPAYPDVLPLVQRMERSFPTGSDDAVPAGT